MTVDETMEVFERIAPCRVRITYANGLKRSGALTIHTVGVHRDPRIDGFGGFFHTPITAIETMERGRYRPLPTITNR